MRTLAEDPLGTICVLGAGRMGAALCRRLVAAGREVVLTARDLAKAAEAARAAGGSAVAVRPATEAFSAANSIVLAVPYPVALRLAHRFPGFAADKIVIDVTNPLTDRHDGLLTDPDTCAAVQLARAIPYTPLVKAFNTLTPGIVATAPLDDRGGRHAVLVAGDEDRSKAAVLTLAQRMGFTGIDAGPLVHARHLEGLVLLTRTIAARNDVDLRQHRIIPTLGTDRRKAVV